MTGSLPEAFYCFNKYCAFIIGIVGYFLYSAKTIIINTKVKLYTKFYRGFCFSSDDWSNPWLCDTDNTVFYAMISDCLLSQKQLKPITAFLKSILLIKCMCSFSRHT